MRIFEWNGSMLHAKTAVADGEWARIGSTNLNLTSWMGNWELDVTVEDPAFAAEMQAMYLLDLENSTEIAIDPRRRVRSVASQDAQRADRSRQQKRVLASALGLGSAAGAAIADVRPLAQTEAKTVAVLATLLLALAGVALFLPLVLTVPLAGAFVWTAIGMLVRSWRLRRDRLFG